MCPRHQSGVCGRQGKVGAGSVCVCVCERVREMVVLKYRMTWVRFCREKGVSIGLVKGWLRKFV